jgi:hypothetical protein
MSAFGRVGTGPTKFTEQFADLVPYKRHVTLGCYHGELPEPAGLLPATGGKQVSGTLSMRSIRITRLDDVSRPALRALIDAAAHHRVPRTSGYLATSTGTSALLTTSADTDRENNRESQLR